LSQSWFKENGTKIKRLSRILEGLAQFKSDGIPLPAGLSEAVLTRDFNFHRCLDMYGLEDTSEEDGYLQTENHNWMLAKGLSQKLVERQRFIKAAWLKAGGLPQCWFRENVTKKMKLTHILKGLAQFKSDVVPLPAGLPEAALDKDFNFHRCLDMFGLTTGMPSPEGIPETALTLIWSKEEFHKESKQRLVERLRVIKAAWIEGGGLPQNWFNENGRKVMILSCIYKGLAQFKPDVVPLPAGLPEATLAKNFNFHNCLDIFGRKGT